MATSSLRRSGVLELRREGIDLRVHGKGDKQREVLIFEELLQALYAPHAQQGFPTTGPVLRGRLGRPLQTSSLQAWLNHWLEGAGLRDPGALTRRNKYSLHSLRRFAAKSWLNSGLNIRQVQMLLGHEDLQTTVLYLNHDLDEIQRAAISVGFCLRRTSQAYPNPEDVTRKPHPEEPLARRTPPNSREYPMRV